MITDKLLMAAGSGVAEEVMVEDVFSAYTYAGNASTQTITTGINLDTKEGMVWIKGRTDATSHEIFDTIRTATHELFSNTTAADTTNADTLTAFSSTGFDLGADVAVNDTSAHNYIAWTFRQAGKFFHVSSQVKAAGVDKTVDLSALGTVGMVTVKRTDNTGDWFVWHRSCTAGSLLYLNKTDAEASLGHITVSGTTLTLHDGVIADGTYIVYAWAHDEGTDGMIQCGTFTTDGSEVASVTLGWEPQFAIFKGADTILGWQMLDNARGWVATASLDDTLFANTTAASVSTGNYGSPNATGFSVAGLTASKVYVYLAIRRGPMRQPTVGTQVYNAIARTGTGAADTVTGVGFPPDLLFSRTRSDSEAIYGCVGTMSDRLRGTNKLLVTSNSHEEYTDTGFVTSFGMNGITVGSNWILNDPNPYIYWFFRRYPGVFDIVCDTGNGSVRTISHNLGVIPELMIRKKRSLGGTPLDYWAVYYGDNTEYLLFNTANDTQDLNTMWNDTSPTATVFTVGTNEITNENPSTFVTYLFATLAGISKVGTYVGNGSNQTVDCGFSTGARWVMIKAIDSDSGFGWSVGDSTRGVIAGNDPYVRPNFLNVVEVTDKDWLDPDNSGFIVNETTGPNANTNGVTYLFLAFS
jgi:hypothetical protein